MKVNLALVRLLQLLEHTQTSFLFDPGSPPVPTVHVRPGQGSLKSSLSSDDCP